MLGRALVGIVDQPNRTVAVRARLDLGQADVPEREGGEDLEEDGGAFVVGEDDAGLEGAVGSGNDGLPGEHHEPGHVA